MAAGIGDYFEDLKAGLASPGNFTPRPYYSSDGDALFFYAEDVQSYAKRVNPILTLFLATDSQRVVGFKIKGVQRILRTMERLGNDKFEIGEHGIKLRIFVELALVAPPDDPELSAGFEDQILRQYKDVTVDRRELELSGLP